MDRSERENAIVVERRRSDYKCLSEGIALVARHSKELLYASWPLVCLCLLVAVVCGFVERAMEVSFFTEEAARSGQWLVLALSLVSALVQVMFLSCVAWQQRALFRAGALPRKRLWKVWRGVLPTFGRVLLIVCIGLVVFLVLVLLCGMAFRPAMGGSSAGSALSVTAMTVIVLCFAVVLTGVLSQVYFEYVVGGSGLRQAFSGLLSWGWRYVGRTLLVAFVSMLLSAVVVLILSLPALVCVYVDSSVVAMRLEGDVADLPGYYPLVLFLSWLFSGIGSVASMLIVSFPLFLNWGALRAIERERLSQAG